MTTTASETAQRPSVILVTALADWVEARLALPIWPTRVLSYPESLIHEQDRACAEARVSACEKLFLHELDKVAPARDGKYYGN